MGREGAVSPPQAKAWPPRTIFLAPALYFDISNRIASAMIKALQDQDQDQKRSGVKPLPSECMSYKTV